MSYDVWYEVEVDGEMMSASEGRNYTSNVSQMWREAGCDIAGFHGRPVWEFAESLAGAIATMQADPDRFRAMNAKNGWGDMDGCIAFFLRPLLKDARIVNQTARVCVSR